MCKTGNSERTVLLMTIFILAALYTVSPAIASVVNISVMPSVLNTSVGDNRTVDILVNPSGSEIVGVQLDIAYDAPVIIVTNVTEDNLLRQAGAETFFSHGTINNTTGKVNAVYGAILAPNASVFAGGSFARINISAVGRGFSNITLSNIIVVSSNNTSLPVMVDNGEVMVGISTLPALSEAATKSGVNWLLVGSIAILITLGVAGVIPAVRYRKEIRSSIRKTVWEFKRPKIHLAREIKAIKVSKRRRVGVKFPEVRLPRPSLKIEAKKPKIRVKKPKIEIKKPRIKLKETKPETFKEAPGAPVEKPKPEAEPRISPEPPEMRVKEVLRAPEPPPPAPKPDVSERLAFLSESLKTSAPSPQSLESQINAMSEWDLARESGKIEGTLRSLEWLHERRTISEDMYRSLKERSGRKLALIKARLEKLGIK